MPRSKRPARRPAPATPVNILPVTPAKAIAKEEEKKEIAAELPAYPKYDKPEDWDAVKIFNHARSFNAEQLQAFKSHIVGSHSTPKQPGLFERFVVRCRDENEAFQLTCRLNEALHLLNDRKNPSIGRDHCERFSFKQTSLPFAKEGFWLSPPEEVTVWTVVIWWHHNDLSGLLAALRQFFYCHGRPVHEVYQIDGLAVIQSADYISHFTGLPRRFASFK